MKCYASTVKGLGLLLLSVLLIGASTLCTILPMLPAQLIGWGGLLLFGLGALLALRRLVQQEPLVIIDEHKIADRRAGWQIPWDDVETVRRGSLLSPRTLYIEVEDPSAHVASASGPGGALNRLLVPVCTACNLPPFTISFQGLTPGVGEAWQHVQRVAPDRTP